MIKLVVVSFNLLILLSCISFGHQDVDSKIKYILNYEFTITKPKASFKEIKLWVPVPENNEYQTILSQKFSEKKVSLHNDKNYLNKMLFIRLGQETKFPYKFTAKYKIERSSTRHSKLTTSKNLNPQNYLSANKKIPLSGVIAEISNDQVKGIKSKSKMIDQLYQYTVDNMSYDKSGKGWGEGDAVWACDNKRGNCTDFHSLLIGMARVQKIPGRFEIGLPIPTAGTGQIKGYHCWAWLYDTERGWIPVDASESKKAGDANKYFGYFPANRIHFSTGRDLSLQPKQKGRNLNYFIYPYLELDGKEYKGFSKNFYIEKIN